MHSNLLALEENVAQWVSDEVDQVANQNVVQPKAKVKDGIPQPG